MLEYIESLAREPASSKLTQMVYKVLDVLDPSFKSERSYYDVAIMQLHYKIRDERRSLLDAILKARAERMNINLAYLVWLGIFQNYACSIDVSYCDFLDMELEDVHTESFMDGFPETVKVEELSKELQPTLTAYEDHYMYIVTSYYCYLETVAYKYAHFAGFCLGNTILPRVLPDFVPNKTLTNNYAEILKTYFEN